MTDKAVNAVMKNKVKLGAELSAAVGPVGHEVEAATTTNVGTDIYSYSRNKGLFVGASFEGAVIGARNEWNEIYYGRKVTPEEILADKVKSAGANALRAAVKRLEQK
jgi:lipid-binding SYLF domain-containing protein